MYEALLVVFLIVAIGLVGLIMLQQGKGADMGASFGAGASGTLFGSSGSGNFMTRMTGILAALFFIISLVLGNRGRVLLRKSGTEPLIRVMVEGEHEEQVHEFAHRIADAVKSV